MDLATLGLRIDGEGGLRALDQFADKAEKTAGRAERASERAAKNYTGFWERSLRQQQTEHERLQRWLGAAERRATADAEAAYRQRTQAAQRAAREVARVQREAAAEQRRIDAETSRKAARSAAEYSRFWERALRERERNERRAAADVDRAWKQHLRNEEANRRRTAQAAERDARRKATAEARAAREYVQVWERALREREAADRRAARQREANDRRAAQQANRNRRRNLDRAEDFGGVLAIAGGALGVREIVQSADAWNMLGARINLVTTNAAQAAHVQRELFAISQDTRTSIEATTDLYLRAARAADQLGRSQNEMLQFTETVNRALVIGGSSAHAATAGLYQLGQALSSGRLQGDEFRSMMENMPEVARVMAKGLGVTRHELREMSQQGKLTSDVIVQSILNMTKSVEEDMRRMPMTMTQSWTILTNEVKRFIGNTDDANNISAAVAGTVLFLANNLSTLVTTLALVTVAWANYVIAVKALAFGPVIVGAVRTTIAFVAKAAAVRTAAGAMTLYGTALKGAIAFLTGPVGIALALTAAVAGLVWYSAKAREAAGATDAFANSLHGLSMAQLDVRRAAVETELFEAERAAAEARKNPEAFASVGQELKFAFGAVLFGTKAAADATMSAAEMADARVAQLQANLGALEEQAEVLRGMDDKIGEAPKVGEDDKGWKARLRAIMELRAALAAMLREVSHAAGTVGLYGMALEETNVQHKTLNELARIRADLEEKVAMKTINAADQTMLMAEATRAYAEAEGILLETMQQRAQLEISQAHDTLARTTEQATEAAFTQGIATRLLAIEHEAVNAAVEAQLNLTGRALELRLANIEAERQLAREALIVQEIAEGIGQTLSNTFHKVLTDGLGSFRELFTGIRDMFFRMLADMAATALMRTVAERMRGLIAGAVAGVAESSAGSGNIVGERGGAGVLDAMTVIAETKNQRLARYARYAGAGLAGLAVGNTIGSTTTNRAGGGLMGGLGGAAAGFAMAGPAGAIAGGLMGIAGGIMGAWNRQKEVARMNREVMQRNTEKLTQMRESIDGSPLLSGKNLSRARPLLDALRGAGGAGGIQGRLAQLTAAQALRGGASAGGLRDLERATGLTAQQLGRMAADMGIELFNEEGKLVAGALEQLGKALDIAIEAATKFGNNMDDITMRQNAEAKLYDLENTPGLALGNAQEILNTMAPDLMRKFGLTNLNLDTEAGRAAMLQGLRDIFELIKSGELTPELLGAFTDKGQLIDAILAAKDGLDAFKNTLADVTTDFPKAMDVILYEQMYGRGAGAGGTVGGAANAPSTPTDTNPSVPGGPALEVHGDIVIQAAYGESGEDILLRVEEAAMARASRGGYTYMPNTVTEGQ